MCICDKCQTAPERRRCVYVSRGAESCEDERVDDLAGLPALARQRLVALEHFAHVCDFDLGL